MNLNVVIGAVIHVLKECQEAFGHGDGDHIDENTIPHGNLKGFQSDVTPTIVRRIAKRLGNPLADDVDPVNIFASKDRQEKLSVRDAAKRFDELYGSKGCKQ